MLNQIMVQEATREYPLSGGSMFTSHQMVKSLITREFELGRCQN